MRKNLALILVTLFFLSSCSTEEQIVQEEVTPKYVVTQIVEEKPFTEMIKLPGKIVASKETSVSSLASGIIDKINVNVGAEVKAGDILATIDTTSNLANIQLSNAITSYNNAVAVYNSSKSALDKTLESAKLQYDNAVIAKNNTYTNTEKQLELAKAQLDATSTQNQGATNPSNTSLDLSTKSLENARLSLENFNTNSQETLKSLETKRNSILSSLRVTIEGSFISFETSLRAIDEILGVTDLNRALNDSFEMYLSAKNSNYKNESETLFTQNNAEFLKLRSEYRTNFNEDELIAFYDRVVKLANDNATLLDKMVLVLNNTVESASFGDSAINYAKSGFVTFQTQFSTLKGNLNSLYNSYFDTINTISSTKTNLDTQKSSLEQAVKLAEATYNNTKANVSNTENTTKIQYETTVESVRAARETADNNLKMALNQYNSARANYDSQLTQLKAQIDGTSGQKNSLSQQIENSQIKAPYDGVVIAKNIEIGSSVGQGAVTFIIATSQEKIVKLDVNAENVKYLNLGEKVTVKKQDKETEGVISVVGAGANANTSMYPVEVRFSSIDFGQNVVLGDFVDVSINKKVGDKNIVLPFSALIANSNGTYHVLLVGSGNLVTEKNVEIGASNSSEIIIRSGLNIGDRVIVNGALNVTLGDKVEER